MADGQALSSPKWKRPDEVMRLHFLKKRKALAARMNGSCSRLSDSCGSENEFNPSASSSTDPTSRNCFRRPSSGLKRMSDGSPVLSDFDASCDNTLFNLLSGENNGPAPLSTPTSFTSVLQSQEVKKEVQSKSRRDKNVPIDWTLRTKVRFMSPKPFAFNSTLRTCEEASGITGFVRCLDTGQKSSTLDTSPNARLHQCCLVWQHPWLPWLELYPRQAPKVSSSDVSFNISSVPLIRDSLQRDWAKSFQSLFQLVRARQCPYFYVCANTFTCLFRAAGICGISEIHALITPTTRGFRQTLKEEDVIFTMPLKKNSNSKRKSSDGASSESGYETMDSQGSENSPSNIKKNDTEGSCLAECEEQDDESIEEDDVSDKWLESMGIEASEIRRLNNVQVQQTLDKERDIDKTPESLIMVEGVEAQALFNFLLNCKSCTTNTGSFAGIPPTLLSPVAFHGSTLRPNKVRVCKVQVESSSYHSVEVQGPVMPHAVLDLCKLLQLSSDEFSLTFANLETTKAFSEATTSAMLCNSSESVKENQSINASQAAPCVFGQENLSDCGLGESTLTLFCSPEVDRVQQMESLKYSTGVYAWV